MSKRSARGAAFAVVAASLLVGAGTRGAHAVPDPTRVGFPSSDPTDGRFLSIPGKGMFSLNVPTHLSLGVPASEGANPFVVDVFDGDQGGKWDKPGGAVTTFALYADRNRDGTSMTLIASLDNPSFADDAWTSLYSGPHLPAAQAASGNYFYRVIVSIAGEAAVLNAYKVAIRGSGQISAIQNEFGVIGGIVQTGRAEGTPPYDAVMTTTDPLPSLDPQNPNPLNTYDGRFDFVIYVPQPGASISLQEGDVDHAADAGAAVPAEAALPPRPGVPADGADGNVLGGLLVDYRPFRVGGPCWYRIVAPDATVLATVTDPSGDAEYETVPRFDTTQVGYYRMEWRDLDMRNTLFLKPAFGVEVFSAESAPAGAPLATGLGGVRGVLFHDRNGNGQMDANEAGIPGVPVKVTNLDTSVVTDVLTNAYGEYAAAVPPGPYVAAPASGTAPDAVLKTTVAGPTPVVTVAVGATLPAVAEGYTDPTGAEPSLALVPQCRGTLTHLGLDVEINGSLVGQFVQVQYLRPGTQSLYDAVSFSFNGRFSQPVLGFNRNLRVVNVYEEAGITHIVVDTTAGSRGLVRRKLRPGNVAVLTGPGQTNTGTLRPLCRPAYVRHGQVLGGSSTIKSMR